MSGFLLDTNIPSELTRKKRRRKLSGAWTWPRHNRPGGKQAPRWFAGVARRYLTALVRRQGRQVKVADGLIVATALHHRLTIVTRNVKDFAGIGVAVLNPWVTA